MLSVARVSAPVKFGILDSTGKIEGTIAFNEANRML